MQRERKMSNDILVIDDAQETLDLLNHMLSGNGFYVITAHDGQEGFEKARKFQPGLVITDVLMPGVDGFSLLKMLKQDASTKDIPVMVITVRAKMKDTFEAMGVEQVLIKPFDADNVLSIVGKYVQRNVTKRPIKDNAAKVSLNTPPSADQQFLPSRPHTRALTQTDSMIIMNDNQKRALIFGQNLSAMKNMSSQLEKTKCRTTIVTNEKRLLVEVTSVIPHLILVQINAETAVPLPEIIISLVSNIAEKSAQLQREAGPVNQPHWGDIFLFRTGDEKGRSNDPTLIERCLEEGAKKYIGAFDPELFLSRVKMYIS